MKLLTSANRGAGPRENRGEGTGVVRVATQERTAGESLKRVESGRNGVANYEGKT